MGFIAELTLLLLESFRDNKLEDSLDEVIVQQIRSSYNINYTQESISLLLTLSKDAPSRNKLLNCLYLYSRLEIRALMAVVWVQQLRKEALELKHVRKDGII